MPEHEPCLFSGFLFVRLHFSGLFILEIRGVYTEPALEQSGAEIFRCFRGSHHDQSPPSKGNPYGLFICHNHNTAYLFRQEISREILKLLSSYPFLSSEI